MAKRPKNSLVYGWGIKDTTEKIMKTIYLPSTNGKGIRKTTWICPYYQDWSKMIQRCFDPYELTRHPTYKGCTVCEEWKYFSNFIKWVDSQPNKDWENCQLDKDFLEQSNRHYSPDTCVYIPQGLNKFTTNSAKARGNLMLGVNINPNSKVNPYVAQCGNPFSSKGNHVGVFPTELEAHKAWQAKKHEYALRLADLQEDPRVADALRQRYSADKDWTGR